MRRVFRFMVLAFVVVGVAVATSAFAQVGNPSDATIASSFGLGTNTDVRLAVIRVVQFLLGFLGLAAVIIVIYAGYLWMTAVGNADRIATAKRILVNAVIGLVIIFAAFAIVTFVINTLRDVTNVSDDGGPCTVVGEVESRTIGTCSQTRVCESNLRWSNFGPACDAFPLTAEFAVERYQPPTRPFASTLPDDMNKRTAKVTIKFNQPVDPTTTVYGTQIMVRQAGTRGGGYNPGDTLVAGTLDTSKAASGIITFQPSEACPQPNATKTCFAADSTFWIEVLNSVRSAEATPRTLNCSPTLGIECRYTFDIGNQIDATDPTARVDAPLNRAPLNSPGEVVKGTGRDNDGVASLQLFASDYTGPCAASRCARDAAQACSTNNDCTKNRAQLGIDLLNPAIEKPFSPYSGTASLPTPVPRYRNGDLVRLETIASDFSGNTGRGIATVTLRPEHCFNGRQDSDKGETAVDCSEDANNPDFCGFCAGSSCDSDPAPLCQEPDQSQCGSNLQCNTDTTSAEGCTCQPVPIISDVDPADGTTTNFVTIIGTGFGTTPGTVTFLGGNRVADLASVAECPADSNWTDEQIVVEVPAGITDGSIEVKRPDGKFDRMNEGLGPDLGEFDENGLVRPALACIIEDSGKFSDSVRFIGKNFSGSGLSSYQAVFGSATGGTCQGAECAESGPGSIMTRVPNILPVTVGSRVKRVSTNAVSNPVNFKVEASGGEPRIDRLDPAQGPVQQYLTITGANFGRSTGEVVFESNGVKTLAGTDFPAACPRESLWSDKQILVKVPVVAVGAYQISIRRPDNKISNQVNFTVNTDPLAPGICLLDPSKGPVGASVDVYGERLGNGSGTSGIKFFNEKIVQWSARTDGTLWHQDTSGSPSRPAWRSEEVLGAKVPPGAETGLLSAVLDGGKICAESPATACTIDPVNGDSCPVGQGPCIDKKASNALAFTVGSCKTNADCETGICCAQQLGDGSTARSCRASCPTPTLSVKSYRWQFTTGNPAPRVVEQRECGTGTQSPSPWKNSTDSCSNSLLNVRFTTDLDFDTNTDGVCSDVAALTLVKCDTEACEGAGTNVPVSILACPDDRTIQRQPVTTSGVWPEPGSWYQATVRHESVVSKPIPPTTVGEPMAEDYSWKFQLGTKCNVQSVSCTPENATIRSITAPNDTQALAANLQAKNCNVLTCADADIKSWTLTPGSSSDPVVFNTPPTASCRTVVRGTRETITSSIATVTPKEPTATAGQCKVNVNLANLLVVRTYPSCQAACTNAAIGAEFNLPLRPSSVSATNMLLFKYQNADCSGLASIVPTTPPVLKGTDSNTIELQVTKCANDTTVSCSIVANNCPVGKGPCVAGHTLDPEACYRTFIRGGSGGVLSVDGTPISNEGVGDDYYKWSFKTGINACIVDHLVTEPKQATVRTIGATKNFQTTPWSAEGGACGAERLNGFSYNYSWNANPNDVATIGNENIAPNPLDANVDPLQVATAVGQNAQCGQGPNYRCEAGIAASVTQNSVTKSDSGTLALQCGFKQAGRCVTDAVNRGGPGDANCNAVLDSSDMQALETRITQSWAGPDLAIVNVSVTNTSGTPITRLVSNEKFVVRGELRNIGNATLLAGRIGVLWKRSDTGATVRGPGGQTLPSDLSVGQAVSLDLKTSPELTVGKIEDTPPLGTPFGVDMEIYRISIQGDDDANNSVRILVASDGTITLPQNPSLRPANDAVTPNDCSGLDVNGDKKINADDRDALTARLNSGTKHCSNDSTKPCGGDGECSAVGQCGGGTPNGSCLVATGRCSNDTAVSCLSSTGFPDDRLCKFAVNTGGCCGARPWVETVQSAKDDDGRTCRNTAFTVTFNTLMNPSSLVGGGKCDAQSGKCSNDGAISCRNGANEPDDSLCNFGSVRLERTDKNGLCGNDLAEAPGPWWRRAWNFVARLFQPSADAAPGAFQCVVEANVTTRVVADVNGKPSKTQAIIYPKELLEADGTDNEIRYRVRVLGESASGGGAASITGIQMRTDTIDSITDFNQGAAAAHAVVGKKLCAIDRVDVEVKPSVSYLQNLANPQRPDRPYDIFSCYDDPAKTGDECSCNTQTGQGRACRLVNNVVSGSPAVYVGEDQNTTNNGNQHVYAASAKVKSGADITATFAWGDGVCRGGSEAGKPCWQASQCAGDGASCDQSLDPQHVVEPETVANLNKDFTLRSNNKNGLANIRVRATSGSGETTTSKEKSVPVTVFLCQNSWSSGPMQDGDNNFLTNYCRGESLCRGGTNNGKSCRTVTDCSGAGARCDTDLPDFQVINPVTPPNTNIRKEWILKDPGSADAVGIRVVTNERHVSPAQWYDEQSFPKGSPSSMVVDGYPAVRDGRTVYVGAGNATGSDNTRKLFTNIYIFSYNQEAKPTTIAIFGQVLQNLIFNINHLGAGACQRSSDGEALKTCSNDSNKVCSADSECGEGERCQVASCLIDSDCRSGYQCASEKAGIVRDTARVSSLLDIASLLEDYRYGTACAKVTPGAPGDADCNGRVDAQDILLVRGIADDPTLTRPSCSGADYNRDDEIDASDVAAVTSAVQSNCKRDASRTTNYPALNAGTYVPGISTSRWPSWDQTLGVAIGKNLAVDPKNYFAPCPDYGSDGTCWNDTKKEFYCQSSAAQCASTNTTLWYPPNVPVAASGGPQSSVYTYTSYGVCDKQRNQECLFDNECGTTGPCLRGEQYALCGFLEACYQPSPKVLNQKYDVTRFCQVTSNTAANRLPAAPAPAASCLVSPETLIPPLLTPPSHNFTAQVVFNGGRGTVLRQAVENIDLPAQPQPNPPDPCASTAPCTETVQVIEGTPVLLTATPTSGSVSWSGCDRVTSSGSRRICEVVMGTVDHAPVRATFTPPAPTVSIVPSKSVIKEGDPVTLTVQTAAVATLLSFTANGVAASCTVAIPDGSQDCLISNQADTTSYRVTVRNSTGLQATATTTVYMNNPPTLSIPQAFQTAAVVAEDGADTNIILRGQDPDGCSYPYTYEILQQPGFAPAITTPGTMTCSAGALQATLIYKPTVGSSGATTLRFRINDGANLSQERTVNITVR